MYYTKEGHSYYAGTEQCHSRASFLILANSWKPGTLTIDTLYATVRKVALQQFGHFMMGTARIKGESITMSGSYGNDGLPLDYDKLSEAVQKEFIEVPEEISHAFWHPEYPGHNSTGSEAPILAKWAIKTFGR